MRGWLSVHAGSVVDVEGQDDRGAVVDIYDDSPVTDSVAPEPGERSGERFTAGAWAIDVAQFGQVVGNSLGGPFVTPGKRT